MNTFPLKVFVFDGREFAPRSMEMEWPLGGEEQRDRQLKQMGWIWVRGLFYRPDIFQMEVFGHVTPETAKEECPDFDLYLLQVCFLEEQPPLNVLVRSEPVLLNLISRWSHIYAYEDLARKIDALGAIMRKNFVISHGHRADDDCQTCNPLCPPEYDVTKRTVPNGAVVVLARDICTKGGSKFAAGEKMIVTESFSGTCNLHRPGKPDEGILGMTVDDFTVVKKRKKQGPE